MGKTSRLFICDVEVIQINISTNTPKIWLNIGNTNHKHDRTTDDKNVLNDIFVPYILKKIGVYWGCDGNK